MKKAKIKVEYGSIPIRHLAIQCPSCESWFMGDDITISHCSYKHDLNFEQCSCPKCGFQFGIHSDDAEESDEFPGFYDKCVKRKIVWE